MIIGFHKEGRVILTVVSLLVAAAFIAVYLLDIPSPWNWIIAVAGIAILYIFFQFFRIPKRVPITSDGAIMSPCDGKVVVIEEVQENEFLKTKCRQISIFMSPLNVHINWYPISGKVAYQAYHPGKYLVAWHPKSSTDNERTTVAVESPKGTILMRQIAGALARRIICYSEKSNTALQTGEMGFIKFGSRVDVFIPLDAEVKVQIDDVVQGTTSVLAEW